jgi:hypothetical protein
MSFETNYQEIRRDAAGLMWLLSAELNKYDRKTIMVNPDVVLQYSNILAWLGGVVCDDWQDIHEISKELETIKLPDNSRNISCGNHMQGLFNNIVREVGKQLGIEIKQDLPDNKAKPINLEEYTLIGWTMGFVEPLKTFFGRSRKAIVNSK